MKSRVKTIIISLNLTVLFSCLIVGLYASNEYSHYLDSGISKYKTQVKHRKNTLKLASLQIPETIEENQELEDWMLNNNFWIIITSYSLDEEHIKESNEIESKWLNNHNFYIL